MCRFTYVFIAVLTTQAWASDQVWSGKGPNGRWSAGANWQGGVAPGSTSGTSSADMATFNSPIASTWGKSESNPIVIDSSVQNIGGINFDKASGNYFIGANSPGANSLLLTSGGAIQMLATLASANAKITINAPIVIEGAKSSTYTFANNSANGADAGTLNFGGDISGGAAGTTILTLSGSSTSNNTISGVIGNGSATTVSIVKDGPGTWALSTDSGASEAYTGSTTITGGTLSLSQPVNSPNVSIGAGAALNFNSGSGDFTQGGITFTGSGTLKVLGGNTVTFGGTAPVNWNLGAGAQINVQAGTMIGGNSNQDTWANNLASLNITDGATFNAVEAPIMVNALTGGGKLTGGFQVGGYKITIGVNNGTGTFTGVIADYQARVNLVKVGTGTQTLAGANTYTGTTRVNAGTLVVTGSLTNTTLSSDEAPFSVIVDSGATLEGTGTVGSTNAGGAILAGAGSASGTLTFSNNFDSSAPTSLLGFTLGPNNVASSIALSSSATNTFYSTQQIELLSPQVGTFKIISGLGSDPGSEANWTLVNTPGIKATFYYFEGNIFVKVTSVSQ